jgi:hypothetical protein
MKNLFNVAIICLATVFAVSCTGRGNRATGNQAIDTYHTSQNALDWAGVYTGVLPCADCEGIQTTIVLNYDNTFEFRTKYLGKNLEEFVKQGSFTWSEQGNIIKLDGVPTPFLVGEGMLFQLDVDGNRMPADVEARYTLGMVSDIVGRTWKLMILHGEAVEVADEERRPYFKLNVEDSRITGNGGCNTVGGTYIIDGNHISFSQMFATRMFCMDAMDLEAEFLRILELTDSFVRSSGCCGMLSLHQGETRLARFQAVD